MHRPLTPLNRLIGLFAALSVLTLLAAGCGKTEQLEHYTVAKPEPFTPPASAAAATEQPTGEPTDRMLAAIVPHGEQGWFFKLMGPKDAVAEKREVFETFLKSLSFSEDGKPKWTVPEGWQEKPGDSIRYATLVIPGDEKPLELTVTSLPKPPGDDENYTLVNINRWRGQLKLPPIELSQLSAESKSLELEGTRATVVDMVGTAAPNSMGRPPFFPGAGNGN